LVLQVTVFSAQSLTRSNVSLNSKFKVSIIHLGITFVILSSFQRDLDVSVNDDILVKEVLCFDWVLRNSFDWDHDLFLDFDLNDVLDHNIILLFDNSIERHLLLDNFLNVDRVLTFLHYFDFDDLWHFNSSLSDSFNQNLFSNDLFVSLLIEVWYFDLDGVFNRLRHFLGNNVLNRNSGDLFLRNWLLLNVVLLFRENLLDWNVSVDIVW